MGEEQPQRCLCHEEENHLVLLCFLFCFQGVTTLKYFAPAFCSERCNDLYNVSKEKKGGIGHEKDLRFGDWECARMLFSCGSAVFYDLSYMQ